MEVWRIGWEDRGEEGKETGKGDGGEEEEELNACALRISSLPPP